MRVSELIDMLKDQPPDAEVELAIVAPLSDEEDDITVDRYSVEGMLPWQDEDDEGNEEEVVIWLVGGEDDDVEAFLDAIEEQQHDHEHDHDHDHDHDHGDHHH
jgi:ABC-type Zn2+ transport system substrate-binding protein/surface adhesin